MDIKIADTNEPVAESPIELADPQGLEMSGRLLIDDIARMLNIDFKEIPQYKQKIQTLIDYAKSKSENHSPEELKWVIKSLGLKLGTPPLGERQINHLNLYAKIHLQELELKRQKERLVRGGDIDDN